MIGLNPAGEVYTKALDFRVWAFIIIWHKPEGFAGYCLRFNVMNGWPDLLLAQVNGMWAGGITRPSARRVLGGNLLHPFCCHCCTPVLLPIFLMSLPIIGGLFVYFFRRRK